MNNTYPPRRITVGESVNFQWYALCGECDRLSSFPPNHEMSLQERIDALCPYCEKGADLDFIVVERELVAPEERLLRSIFDDTPQRAGECPCCGLPDPYEAPYHSKVLWPTNHPRCEFDEDAHIFGYGRIRRLFPRLSWAWWVWWESRDFPK